MGAPPNPYSSARTVGRGGTPIPSAVQQNSAYATPSELGPYTREQGWSPSLRTGSQSTPDASRSGTIPRYDYRPDPVDTHGFWNRIDVDDKIRHSVEDQDADGWKETKSFPGYPNPSTGRFGPNPRAVPPPEPRPTTSMSPRTYSFTRPFDQLNRGSDDEPLMGSARHLTGNHFSMADHRRNYPILGMTPPMRHRNTYRLEPAPWDTNIVDMPPDVQLPNALIQSVNVPPASRSYRLG